MYDSYAQETCCLDCTFLALSVGIGVSPPHGSTSSAAVQNSEYEAR